jgi:hypothetical protein
MGIGITDNPALGGARVDTNHDLGVALQPDEGEAGFAALTAESNPADVGVGRRTRALEVSADYRLRIGLDAFLFRDNFSHSQITTSKWPGRAPVPRQFQPLTDKYLQVAMH